MNWHIAAKALRVLAALPHVVQPLGVRPPVAVTVAAAVLQLLADVVDPEADDPVAVQAPKRSAS